MPTYEYRCLKCGEHFDTYQSIADKPLTTCPKEKCRQKVWGRGKVKRAITAGGGLLFKGSGFYTTDYRSDSYKKAAKKDSAPATSPAGDSKPAVGSDSKTSTAKAESKPAKNAKTDGS